MKRIEIRGMIVPSAYDSAWWNDYIAKGAITPESRIRQQFAEASEDIELYINSSGGSVFSGSEIVNAIKQFRATGKKIEITVGALAASMAANIIATAGAVKVKAHKNSKIMFHGAHTVTMGGQGTHDDTSSLLNSINADVIDALASLPNAQRDKIEGWFAEGRAGWLNAQQALDMGIVSEIIDATDSALAKLDAEAAKKMLADGIDAAALDFTEPAASNEPSAATVPQADYDALMARFTGLQSAKDKELAALNATLAALTQERDTLQAANATLTTDLGTATAALSTEKEAHAKTQSALADTAKQRDEAAANHKALVGKVLGTPPDAKSDPGVTGLARIIAAQKAKQ